MTNEQIIKEIEEKFVFEEDNVLPALLYRVNEDGTRTIAQPYDIKSLVLSLLHQKDLEKEEALAKQKEELIVKIQGMDKYKAEHDLKRDYIRLSDILSLLK